MAWLTAVTDRATCGMIATDGQNLYKEELAKDLKEHFQDVLDSLDVTQQDDEDSLLGIGLGWHGTSACLLVCGPGLDESIG